MTTMPFIDFNAIDRERREWQEAAKHTFVSGIDPADLKPGMRVTISPNLRIADRSGCDSIHTVVAVNSSHVQMISDGGWDKGKPRLWMIHEHHFYDASHFAASEADSEPAA